MRKLTVITAVLLLVAALGATAVLARSPEQAALPAPAVFVQQAPAVAPAVQEDVAPADTAPTWGPGQMRGQMQMHRSAGMGAGMMGAVWGDQNAHDIIAATLGMTAGELTAAVQGGATIESLAAEKGVAVENITAAISAAHEAGLQQAVAAGTITAEQAELMQARMTEMWTLRLQEGSFFGGRSFGNGNGTGPNPDCPMQDGSGNPAGRGGAQMQGRGFGQGQRGMQGQGNQAPAANGING
jgi:hypothetical protein